MRSPQILPFFFFLQVGKVQLPQPFSLERCSSSPIILVACFALTPEGSCPSCLGGPQAGCKIFFKNPFYISCGVLLVESFGEDLIPGGVLT